MASGVFTVVFNLVAKLPSDGSPYFLFVFAGFLGWNSFQNTLQRCSISLIGNTSLVTKVYFPRILLPASSVLASLLDFAVGFVVLLGLLIARGELPPFTSLLLVPLVLTLQVLALGVDSSWRRSRSAIATCSTCSLHGPTAALREPSGVWALRCARASSKVTCSTQSPHCSTRVAPRCSATARYCAGVGRSGTQRGDSHRRQHSSSSDRIDSMPTSFNAGPAPSIRDVGKSYSVATVA